MGKRARRIVFAGGGTGGHLYPALAVADELRRRHPEAAIAFVGARGGLEQRLVPQAGYPVLLLPLSGIKGKEYATRLWAVVAAGWGVLRCLAWMLRDRPDLVIGVGGFASGPAVLAAWLSRVKTMVMEQNHYPGATNRWLGPRVAAVCVPSAAAARRLGGRTFITGNPVRPEFTTIGEPPGRSELALLVFGGSRGAHSLNRAMAVALDPLARLVPPPRITHQTGTEDEAEVAKAYRQHYPEGLYDVRGFYDDMPARLAAADLVISRSGAGTLAELAAAGRPAILVPYPHAADDHQRHNAETLQEAGAALVLLDRELDGEHLAATIAELAAAPERRRAMGRAARGLARPDAARRIAEVAERVIDGSLDELRGADVS